MNKLNSTTAITFLLSLILISCGKTNESNHNETGEQTSSNQINPGDTKGTEKTGKEDFALSGLIDDYLEIKNALVSDDPETASMAARQLVKSIESLDLSSLELGDKQDVEKLINSINEHGIQIIKNEIALQREHFERMGKDYVRLISLTGTDRELHLQHCPMYEGGVGGSWLSESTEIFNPLFGSKMLRCGRIEESFAVGE